MIQNSSVHWTYSGDEYCTANTIAEGSVRLWNLRRTTVGYASQVDAMCLSYHWRFRAKLSLNSLDSEHTF